MTTTMGQRRLLFTCAEVCRVTGLSKHTLASWTEPTPGGRWVEPYRRGGPGRNNGHKFSAWQLTGLAVIEGCLRSSRFANTRIGKHGVVAAMAGLADRDDALLLPPAMLDFYKQEATAIAAAAICAADLPEEARENLVRVIGAIHDKAQKWNVARVS